MVGNIMTAQPRPRPPPGEKRPEAFSVNLNVGGRPLRLLGLPTGTVAIKKKHMCCACQEDTNYPSRFADILADSEFAPPLPVYTYAIEHPDGTRVAVDTGTDPLYWDPATWKGNERDMSVMHSCILLDILPKESLAEQLTKQGMQPVGFRGVVLTHMHVDHTGGVPIFGPSVPVWTSKAEIENGSKIGAIMWRWSSNAQLVTVEDAGTNGEVGLTEDGSVAVVHTPGHTPGSLSVRIRTDSGVVWLCGDSTFDLPGMKDDAVLCGIHFYPELVRKEHERLRAEVAKGALVLPSHDWTAPERARAFAAGERPSMPV
uniref:Metallo-beta-lactamase domain-containing protein n=1 Tax=Chromera velia CCMP2878 TaxID=1169474 RepID=A0A0G4I8X3_9ALVE|eukprot:Cvel_12009.t1-p1 / transcript=Cvel_12009.t1 / gene=Cvel_12009 / organism=Chromera_velia_CCMP2878 / gene_product=N-acyl homoserine lactonase, putative / transcript_product=N-acyl homoserine lactonase, putative / location=Cvel_scaffold771:18612-19553(+) / protein_length=314 / sequence_SO=supercontig / SO=protein_coding / is_pseudo=false